MTGDAISRGQRTKIDRLPPSATPIRAAATATTIDAASGKPTLCGGTSFGQSPTPPMVPSPRPSGARFAGNAGMVVGNPPHRHRRCLVPGDFKGSCKASNVEIRGRALRQAGGECTHVTHGRSLYDHRPSHPYNVGTEHVGCSSTRQTLPAPSAKPRDVLDESHEE